MNALTERRPAVRARALRAARFGGRSRTTLGPLARMWHPLARGLLLGPLMLTTGCASLYMPLTADEGYPAGWGTIVPLGQECRSMSGEYDNTGTVAINGQSMASVFLTNVLGLPESATRLSITVITQRRDKDGDSLSTLEVRASDDAAVRRELKECFCVKQTLMCKVAESYRAIPYVSIGGAQRNVYFSLAHDGALIAKLQDYHIDVVFVVPVYGKRESWARFVRSKR